MPDRDSALAGFGPGLPGELVQCCLDEARRRTSRPGYGFVGPDELAVRILERLRVQYKERYPPCDAALRQIIARIALTVYSEALYWGCSGAHRPEQNRAYAELGTFLYRTAYNWLLTTSAPARYAEDCSQDALLQVWRSIGSCRQPGAFLRWATVIVIRIAQRGLRGEPGCLPLPSDEWPILQAEQNLQHEAENRDEIEILLAAIRRLPDVRQQQVLLWGFLAELNDEEIAGKLGITRNHVHQLRHRALLRLRADPSLVARLQAYLGVR